MSQELIKAVEDGLKHVEGQVNERMKVLEIAVTELAQQRVAILPGHGEARSLKGALLNSGEFLDWCRKSGSGRVRLELKNTVLGESGSPQNPDDTLAPAQRMVGIVGGAFRSLSLLDFIPRAPASSNQVEYTKESTWTNDAGETAEGGQKPESDVTFSMTASPVRTIAHWLKVSKQALDDAPALAAYLDQRMRHGVLMRLQNQLIGGDGTAPNLSGILDSGNHTSVSAGTGDNALDFANRLKYAVIGADFSPSFYLINPGDWGAMERLKKGTGDDSYIGAEGAIGYLANGLTPTLWGLPVIASNSVTSGQMICAAAEALMLWERQGVVVEMFEQDDTNVQKNLVTIRAEMRAAFSVLVPAAVRAGTIPA